jgi:PPOX class probable FMN-dependent enzyme
MEYVETLEDLEELYAKPGDASLFKVAKRISPAYLAWIEAARFCILSTVGPEGTDGSPRGDDGSVVRVLDQYTLALPDWRGNNRLDSLRNIVSDGRVSLMFMVPGKTNVVRVNGTARLSLDADLISRFEQKGRHPRTVILIRVAEVYSQCARALMRARLWENDDPPDLPSVGDILREQTEGDFDGVAYDVDWAERAKQTMW